MKILIIINDAAYGTEKAFNAFRLAMTFQKEYKDVAVNIFLIADAVSCAIANQKTPDGYYNLERMLKSIIQKGGMIGACGSCLDARGLNENTLIKGIERSTMSQLSQWAYEADKVVSF